MKALVVFLLAASLYAQGPNGCTVDPNTGNSTCPPIVNANGDPTGTACIAGLPNLQVKSTGNQYSCQHIVNGRGSYSLLPGSGSGTVNAGTTGQIAYYPGAGTAVNGNVATVDNKGNITAASILVPTFAPANYIAYGDSITNCGSLTLASSCYVNHLALDLNILAATNRSVSGDEAADVVWRIQSADNPAVAANPNLYTLMIGTNDADQNGVSASFEANYKLFHTAILSWHGTPASSKVAGSTATATGTCANDTTLALVTGEACTANASTLTFSSVVTTGGVIDVWYRSISADAGTWTYAVDGGTAVAVNTAPPINFTTVNSHTSSMGLLRITGVSAGTHSIVFTQTHSGTMSILAVGSLPSITVTSLPRLIVTDVIHQLDGNKLAATSAYSADAQADVTQMAGDGFNVVLAPMASTLQATTAAADMLNTLHPNDAGHLELYRAVRAATPFRTSTSLPITYNPAGSGAFTFSNFQTLTFGGSSATQAANFQNAAGTSEIDIRSKDNTKYSLLEYYYNNTVEWAHGLFPGICAATNDWCLYSFNQSARVFNINSTTGAVTEVGAHQAPLYLTTTNCSSSASPAVCAAASAGSVVVAASATTVVVNTTAVTANSQIQLTEDSSLGTKLSVTCNVTPATAPPTVSARTAATSFTITTTTPTTNPRCFSYSIVN